MGQRKTGKVRTLDQTTRDRVYRDRAVRVFFEPDGVGYRWSCLLYGQPRCGGPHPDEDSAAATAASIIDRDVGSKGRWEEPDARLA